MALLAGLRSSAKSFARTPGLTLALVLTIALGIGSNAVVHGFVRGLVARDSPLLAIDRMVSLFARDVNREAGTVSYDEFVSLTRHQDTFEWLGAAREVQGTIVLPDQSAIMAIAVVTPAVAELLDLPLDDGVVISDRVWHSEFRGRTVRGEQVRIDGIDARVAGVAPDWLDCLYAGRSIDIWMPLREEFLQQADRSSRSFWVLGRLRAETSIHQAQAAVHAGRSGSGEIRVVPYTGMTLEAADGLSRVGSLLGVAAGAVFFIACANVGSFLLGRASARSHETSVRVALGASRGQLARQLLSDSVLISVTGGAFGVLLAVWTSQIVPALFFDQDAEHLVFAPDLFGILAASAACAVITVACGLLPLAEIRLDRPADVLRRESAGPSKAMRRLRAGLVVAQMTCCCMLVICTGLLRQGLHTALRTSVSHRLGQPILASVNTRADAGLKYFRDVDDAAQSVANVSRTAWTVSVPGDRPAWQSVRVEPAHLPLREVTMDVVAFMPDSLSLITLPPRAGRMFGAMDRPQTCRVAIVNEEAADELFDGDAVGRSIEDPAGKRVEIIGVVATRKAEHATERSRPTIYYYASQTATPLEMVGPSRFRVPAGPKPVRAVLDANVVSPSYFDAMALSPVAGGIFPSDPAPFSCRVAVINQEAAELYFDGNAVGAAVIDSVGRRTEITGVVKSPPLQAFQRRVEPAIYFPMNQDFPLYMTVILGTREANDLMVADVHGRLDAVAGRGPFPLVVKTLDAHLSRTALAPLRIATVLVGAFAATALTLGALGVHGALTDAARHRRREMAVRIALGAQGWRVIGQVLGEGGRLAAAGTAAGMLGSLLVARWLSRITPGAGSAAAWVWLATPLVLAVAVAIAGLLPARRALTIDPLTITRDDN